MSGTCNFFPKTIALSETKIHFINKEMKCVLSYLSMTFKRKFPVIFKVMNLDDHLA